MKNLSRFIGIIITASCAQLHHVHIGEIDNRLPGMKPFDIKVSETGVDFKEAASVASRFSRSKFRNKYEDMVEMLQFGPRTGAPTFNDTYPDAIFDALAAECPTGKITGLSSVRETRKYPVISGEIVKLTGYCIR